jgi:hypothetical protein
MIPLVLLLNIVIILKLDFNVKPYFIIEFSPCLSANVTQVFGIKP